MIVLTEEETKAHKLKVKEIRKRNQRALERYMEGDITEKKLRAIRKDVQGEEAEYLKSTGIILYYGRLFRKAI